MISLNAIMTFNIDTKGIFIIRSLYTAKYDTEILLENHLYQRVSFAAIDTKSWLSTVLEF